jgi:beta-ureidopropionase / N-carbamoyl-L-amino-acid hydrolase
MTQAAVRVDAGRLTGDLSALSAFGRTLSGGVSRTSYSAADGLARDWLAARCADAGFSVRVDGLGNIFARLTPAGADRSLPAVWTGSHLDSVPNGGMLDGALGVVGALECLRRLKEEQVALRRPVQLVVFADEEGCYSHLLGSTGLALGLTRQELAARRGRDGGELLAALAAAGLDPDAAASTRLDPADVHAFVELHIEQGPVLESGGIDIGVVTSIVGIGGALVEFIGRADHAGTTPMQARQDALQAAAEFLVSLPEAAAAASDHAVITCGLISVAPGATNVVPGSAALQLDFRDVSMTLLEMLQDKIVNRAESAAARCSVTAKLSFDNMVRPVTLDAGIEAAIEDAARNFRYSTCRMPSGAGHDTQNMARITRAGMIFVPSVNGRSHTPEESTKAADLERGANVLLETVTKLCRY